MSFKILGTGSYAPEHVVTNDDLSALVDTNDEWITQRIGVRSRHISETETNVDMAVKAAERALENAGINEVNRYAVVLITCPYSLLGTVQNLLPEHNCIVEETDYAADVTLTATLPEDGTAALEQALRDATSANADMEIMDTQFMGRRIK